MGREPLRRALLHRAALEVTGELAGLATALTDIAWRAVWRRGGPLTLTAPASPLTVPIGGARALAGRAWPIERLRLIAKCADATVNEVVLTMCSGRITRIPGNPRGAADEAAGGDGAGLPTLPRAAG
jgi:diacylglycerol O-acyltransferase